MLDDPDDDPELYEFLPGRCSKKETVGRADHSAIELAIAGLLHPQAAALRARVMHEWTVVQGAEKIIPDVTFSFPNPTMHEGYLVAPAFLVVECRPAGRKLKSLFDKCRLDHHRMATPYCWIIDVQEQCGYECHKEMNGRHLPVETLSAGAHVRLSVAVIFDEFHKATAW